MKPLTVELRHPHLSDRLKTSKVQKSTFNPFPSLPLSLSFEFSIQPSIQTWTRFYTFSHSASEKFGLHIDACRRWQGAISEIPFNLLAFTKKRPLPSFVGTSSLAKVWHKFGGNWGRVKRFARMRLAEMIVVRGMDDAPGFGAWNLLPWNWVYGYGRWGIEGEKGIF